ncbi:hypothetical protein PPERSA_00829 [Pseudocohnilembus persalinus]|uniref:Uncharacterized protein n=1 Tax=Pseudocohnilembus persalinus TaxID=266149 RepID=A0A0V0R761_PSEPJ|nr:hypothetical protein PPERSA_00829 [Pseudocohnilembus persalinus]|eukprot:KRX10349.1 hypothetical protein PPERSA_00829 [Pseudocohnilembus persalinus]
MNIKKKNEISCEGISSQQNEPKQIEFEVQIENNKSNKNQNNKQEQHKNQIKQLNLFDQSDEEICNEENYDSYQNKSLQQEIKLIKYEEGFNQQLSNRLKTDVTEEDLEFRLTTEENQNQLQLQLNTTEQDEQ